LQEALVSHLNFLRVQLVTDLEDQTLRWKKCSYRFDEYFSFCSRSKVISWTNFSLFWVSV